MPELATPVRSIEIDRRRMLAKCVVDIMVGPKVNDPVPRPALVTIRAQLEKFDPVRLRVLYEFRPKNMRALAVDGTAGMRVTDSIRSSLLNEDPLSADDSYAIDGTTKPRQPAGLRRSSNRAPACQAPRYSKISTLTT